MNVVSNSNHSQSVLIYPLSNYVYETDNGKLYEDKGQYRKSPAELLSYFETYGMRKKVQAAILTHINKEPHLLLLRESKHSSYTLPGDYLNADEAKYEEMFLKKKLSEKLDINNNYSWDSWHVVDRIAQWWRPGFDNVYYPYCPCHIKYPKEQIIVYLVELTDVRVFTISRNHNLMAIPLVEIYENSVHYGPIVSRIPLNMSKYAFECIE